eukprot:5799714-Prymnesium_polylepis.1
MLDWYGSLSEQKHKAPSQASTRPSTAFFTHARRMPQCTIEPVCLNSFYREHPEFLVCPATTALLLAAAWRCPASKAFTERHGLEMWGADAIMYVGFSVLFQFAFHGFICTYFDSAFAENKLQPSKPSQPVQPSKPSQPPHCKLQPSEPSQPPHSG